MSSNHAWKAVLVLGLLVAGRPVAAQETVLSLSARPAESSSITGVSFGFQESPSDVPAATCDAGGCETPGCDHHGGSCSSCGSCGDGRCPWTLFPELGRGVRVGGWLSGGATVNADGLQSGNGNFPVQLGNVSDGFIGNQIWGFIARDAELGQGIDWGFRVDYVYGTDGPDTQTFGDRGWDFGWTTSRDYGSAIPQIYFELTFDRLRAKFGHFFTPVGFEAIPAPANFFYSHAMTFYYGEPFTNTGVLLDYTANSTMRAYGGYVTGWDGSFENRTGAHMFLGGLSWTPSDYMALDYMVTAGRFGNGSVLNNGNLYMHSLVFKVQVSDRLQYVLQTDYSRNFDLPAGAVAEWYGINNYAFYELNDCWEVGARIEWFRDKDGTRLPVAGNYYEATAGLNWKPTANLRVRPEVRWDWYQGTGTPFDNGTEKSLVTFGCDFILQF